MGAILLIEDEEPIRELLKAFLQNIGFTVDVAETGEEGIRLLASDTTYVAVLTDVKMPGKGGVDVAAYIRRSDHPDVPIVAMTGFVGPHFQSDRYDMVLAKPFKLEALKRALHEVLS